MSDPTRAWRQLTEWAARVPLLFGSPRVERGERALRVTTGRTPQIVLPGIVVLTLLFTAATDDWREVLVRAVFIAAPIVVLLSCFWGPRSVTWDRSGSVTIRFGPWYWPRRISLRSDDLRGELAFSPMTSRLRFQLLLWRAESDQPCLLAAASDRTQLLSAFHAVREFTEGRTVDRSVELLALPDHTELTVSRGTMHSPGSAAPCIRQHCDDLLLIGPSWLDAALVTLAALLGVGVLTWSVLGRHPLPGLVGGLLLAGLCWRLVWYPRSRIDRATRTVSAWYAVRYRPTLHRFDFSQIAAVQICRQWVSESDGPGEFHYQINLVLCRTGTRVPLWNRTDQSQTRRAAARIAQFIGVPLLDHDCPP